MQIDYYILKKVDNLYKIGYNIVNNKQKKKLQSSGIERDFYVIN